LSVEKRIRERLVRILILTLLAGPFLGVPVASATDSSPILTAKLTSDVDSNGTITISETSTASFKPVVGAIPIAVATTVSGAKDSTTILLPVGSTAESLKIYPGMYLALNAIFDPNTYVVSSNGRELTLSAKNGGASANFTASPVTFGPPFLTYTYTSPTFSTSPSGAYSDGNGLTLDQTTGIITSTGNRRVPDSATPLDSTKALQSSNSIVINVIGADSNFIPLDANSKPYSASATFTLVTIKTLLHRVEDARNLVLDDRDQKNYIQAQADMAPWLTLISQLSDPEKSANRLTAQGVQTTINNQATSLVADAELSSSNALYPSDFILPQKDVDKALALVSVLPSGAIKSNLLVRLLTLQSKINTATGVAIAKAVTTSAESDISIAQDLVTGLPSGTTKIGNQAFLDVVQAPFNSRAITAVQNLETETAKALSKADFIKAQSDKDSAAVLVTALPTLPLKENLQKRLTLVQDVINATQSVLQAETDTVGTLTPAGVILAQGHVETARPLVNLANLATTTTQQDLAGNLTDLAATPIPIQTNLQTRLSAVQVKITNAVGGFVTKAESDLSGSMAPLDYANPQTDVKTAQPLIAVLPIGAAATAFQNRIDAVQSAINTVVTGTVIHIETETSGSKPVANFITAQLEANTIAYPLVNALPSGDIQSDLLARLAIVQSMINDVATTAVLNYVISGKSSDLAIAQSLVTGMPGSSNAPNATKVALQGSIDTVIGAINTATAAVAQSETDTIGAVLPGSYLTPQADIQTAMPLVAALANGDSKLSLQGRLDVVQGKINSAAETALHHVETETAQANLSSSAGDFILAQNDLTANVIPLYNAIASAQTIFDSLASALPLVNSLASGTFKTNLQTRIATVQSQINAAATTAVHRTETETASASSPTSYVNAQADLINNALPLVVALPSTSIVKTDLQSRLVVVQGLINTAVTAAVHRVETETAVAVSAADFINAQNDLTNKALPMVIALIPTGNGITDPQSILISDLKTRLSTQQTLINAAAIVSVHHTETETASLTPLTAFIVAQSDLTSNAQPFVTSLPSVSVSWLPAISIRGELQNKLTAVQTLITAATRTSVSQAETDTVAASPDSLSDFITVQTDVNTAQTLLAGLPSSVALTQSDLPGRLTTVQNAIVVAALAAGNKVETDTANASLPSELIAVQNYLTGTAKALYTGLPTAVAANQSALRDQLVVVQSRIDTAVAAMVTRVETLTAAAVTTQAIVAAQNELITIAQKSVTLLPAAGPKSALQARLDSVQSQINAVVGVAVTKAESDTASAVSTADFDNVNSFIADRAQILVNKLPSPSLEPRLGFQLRLNIVKAIITASKAVLVAEAHSSIANPDFVLVQNDVTAAQTKVNDLIAGQPVRLNLQGRLDILQTNVLTAATQSVRQTETDTAQALLPADYVIAQNDLNIAQGTSNNGLVTKLPTSISKTALLLRMAVLQAEIDAAVSAFPPLNLSVSGYYSDAIASKDNATSDWNIARSLVDALPTSDTKTAYSARLDAAKIIIDATTAVVNAEGTPSVENISAAQTSVASVPSTIKKYLLARVAVALARSDISMEFPTTSDYLSAERDLALAQLAVTGLQSVNLDAGLQAELNSLQISINIGASVAIRDAPLDSQTIQLVTGLPTGDAKNVLLTQYVAVAESSVNATDFSTAQSVVTTVQPLITSLPALQTRLNAVSAILVAAVAVTTAEGTPTKSNYDAAYALINPPSGALSAAKAALNNRLLAVKRVIDSVVVVVPPVVPVTPVAPTPPQAPTSSPSALAAATSAVSKAELSIYQGDLAAAKAQVDALEAGTIKTELLRRITVVQAKIDAVISAGKAAEKAAADKAAADKAAADKAAAAEKAAADKAAAAEKAAADKAAADQAAADKAAADKAAADKAAADKAAADKAAADKAAADKAAADKAAADKAAADKAAAAKKAAAKKAAAAKAAAAQALVAKAAKEKAALQLAAKLAAEKKAAQLASTKSATPTPSPTTTGSPTPTTTGRPSPTTTGSPTPTSSPSASPKSTAKPSSSPSSSEQSITSITCVKGNTVTKVTGKNPICPSGYQKK